MAGNTKPVGVAYADPVLESASLSGVLVANLPAPAGNAGMRATVTDSTAALTAGIGATVSGGSTNIVPVFCNGTVWQIG
jgi:hypothetical protein